MLRVRITGEQVLRIRGADTQADFARLVGAADGRAVSRWERGHAHPSRAFLRALEEVARRRGVDLGNGREVTE